MLKNFSKSIYQYSRPRRYYDILEILSEAQIQLSLFEFPLLQKGKNNFSMATTIIQQAALFMNLRSSGLYDFLMDNFIINWILSAILYIYLIIPLLILLAFINRKYAIVPKISYLWISHLGYIHLYFISFIIHGWLAYQIKKSLSQNAINSAFLGFSLALIIINIAISIFICKACISQVYISGFISYKSMYHKWMNLGFKFIFPIFQAYESSVVRNILLVVFLMIWCIIRQINLIFSNPFYDCNTAKIMSGTQGITFGIIISNSIAVLIKILFDMDIEYTCKFLGLLLLISSLSSKCIMEISTQTRQKLFCKKKGLSDIDYASQYVLLCQFTDDCHKKGLKNQNIKEDELISNGLLFCHQAKCTECYGEESLQLIRNHLLETKISEGLDTYKDSFILNCLALDFFIHEKYDAFHSCFLLEKLKTRILSIEDKLILKAYELKTEEILYNASKNSNLNYEKFAACEIFQETFLCSAKNAAETYLKFWTEISSPRPNLLNIINFALQIREDHQKFKKKLKLYERKFMDSFGKPWLLAGLYYDILKNNHDKSFFMLQQYRKFMIHNSCKNILHQFTEDNFYSKDNVMIRISAADETLGNVISCSGNIAKITGLNAGKLINKNITQILPNFFRKCHNDFLKDYKQTGIGSMINETTYQFCNHKYGHLVPVEINILVYPILDGGLMFLGIIRTIKASHEYILINQDGLIEGMTLKISKELNLQANDKINFCSLLYLNMNNSHKELDTQQNISANYKKESLSRTRIEPISSTCSIKKRAVYLNNDIHIFSNFSQQSTILFQNFADIYLTDNNQDGRKIILKKNYNKNDQKVRRNNIILNDYCEYIASLEKICYKFDLKLYKLKLKKYNNGETKSNSKTQLRAKKYEHNTHIRECKRESIVLLVNQPFMNKPEFIREFPCDSNNQRRSTIKKENGSFKSHHEQKISLFSLNTIMPKRDHSIDTHLNFHGDNPIIKESIGSDNKLYTNQNLDQSYSINSVYFSKNTNIKLKIPQKEKKEKNVSKQLFRFRSIFLEMNTKLMILLFLVAMASIFLMKSLSMSNIAQISQDLMISYHCNQRLANLIETDRRLRYAWLVDANLMSDKRHLSRNITSYFASSIKRAYEVSQYLIGNNSLIAEEMQYLDLTSQNKFYSQIVKLYNVDMSGRRLPNYTETNSFMSAYQIYEVVNRIRSLPIEKITINTTDLLFILRNNLNDIYIEYKISSNILVNGIDTLINTNKQISFVVSLIILTISVISIILLVPGLDALFYRKKSLIMQIVNINNKYCQSQLYKINQFFKSLKENCSDNELMTLCEENQTNQKSIEARKSYDQNNKQQNNNPVRMVNTFGIKLDIAKSFLIIFAITTIYIGLFFTNTIVVGIYMEDIKIATQRILFSSRMVAQQSFTMTIIYEFIGENGTTIVENEPIGLAINESMPIIADLEGFLTNFRNLEGDLDPNLEFIMIGNACTLVPPDYTNECVTIGNGPAQNGISNINSFVYQALSTAKAKFENSNRTIQDANDTFALSYLIDLEGMFYRVTMSVYSYLYNQLLEEFSNKLDSYTIYSLTWTLSSFFCILIIKILIWFPINRKLINEIMSMRRIMKIIPKSIMDRNKFY